MNVLKTIYFGTMLTVLTIYHALLVLLTSFAYKLLRKPYPTEIGHQMGINWGRRVMALTPGWHVEFTGKENIPQTRSPFIIVANHESTADIFAIFLLGTQFKWLAKYELFQIPILGYAMKENGYIPVKRGDRNGHKKALEDCKVWIERGFSLLFFPEGTRSEDGSPKKFKSGAFKMAIETNTPILPVVLSGAGKLLRKGSICPQSATLKISVLPLVYHKEKETIDELTERVQEIVVSEHARLTGKTSLKNAV